MAPRLERCTFSLVEARVVSREMRAYYDRRAGEYDDWWLGAGLFAERDRPGWAAEVKL